MSESKPERAKKAARRLWGQQPAGQAFALDLEPGTSEFFDRVRHRRAEVEYSWLPRVVPFERFRDRDVLEIGCGAGYDAMTICEAGARYTGIDLVPANGKRTRRHLAAFGFQPGLAAADAELMPFRAGSFDFAFSNGVLHHTPNFDVALREAHRVLRPSGEFWIIVYHRDSVFHWVTLFLVDHLLMRGYRRQSFAERLSMIEGVAYDAAPEERPLVRVYSRGELRHALAGAGFRVLSTRVRKLTRDDLPNLRILRPVTDRLSASLLARVGHALGWYVVAHAVKR